MRRNTTGELDIESLEQIIIISKVKARKMVWTGDLWIKTKGTKEAAPASNPFIPVWLRRLVTVRPEAARAPHQIAAILLKLLFSEIAIQVT